MSRIPIAFAAILAALSCAAAVRNTSVEVESVSVNGGLNDGAYVKTDINITSNSEVEVQIEIDTSWVNKNSNSTIFSACGVDAKDRAYVLTYVIESGWAFTYNGSSSTYNWLPEKGRIYTLRTTPNGLYLDGELVLSKTLANFAPPGPLTLFGPSTYNESTGAYTSSNWGRAKARIYSFKIYEPDESGELQLVHNLKGCYTDAGKVAIYDAITDSVYANNGTDKRLSAEVTVHSENGVGDVDALTNVLALANSNGGAKGIVKMEPGIYDLSPVYMDANSHLKGSTSSQYIGLGAGPEDTVLLGGGSSGTRRVFNIGSGTITNMTVTGGHLTATSYGGGIVTSAAGDGAVLGCIVTNNYAKGGNGNGGGGIWGAGTVRGCLIANNQSNAGGGCRSCTVMSDCIISNNYATSTGGGVSGGKTIDCTIVDNRCINYGGGQTEGSSFNTLFLRNVCGVNGSNVGRGGGLHNATASNCVLVANGDNSFSGAYGSAAFGSSLIDSVITNSVGRRSLFDLCSLKRCYIADSGARNSDSTWAFNVFGRYTGSGTYTNVNCVVENISLSNANDRVAMYSALVNCTIRNVKCKTNGPLDKTCTAFNTIVSGCTPYDLVAGTTSTQMVNCVYQTASGTFAEGQLVDCKQAMNLRYDATNSVPCAIRANSPAYNAALADDWILDLVGDRDFAGNPRVMFGALDIGAVECQSDYVPGLMLMFW